ncbi:hypothetical protein DPMN_029651 [Dreissena polymorpha]|uniref:Uncharacterized protein n=1 Tax=Dreissena polymorpha TaxID=45954 RepID=A0A9D4LXL5_DREPO|nr:hypothetical protein DPMN_029651 [Dreissena polymorpha]
MLSSYNVSVLKRVPCSTDSLRGQLFPVGWVTVPASWICSSAETLSVSTSLVLAVLNCSTSEDSTGCSLFLFPYSPTLQKLGVFLATCLCDGWLSTQRLLVLSSIPHHWSD